MIICRQLATLLLPLLVMAGGSAASPLPHILLFLVDDLGHANVGWTRPTATPEVQTPVMDNLVQQGIFLSRFYAFKYCSPSRSALQTGRNPIHVNVVNPPADMLNPTDDVSGYSGIPTAMTGIAEKLTTAGYETHAVGKWDCGMATPRHTPAGRGYRSWLGYYNHCNDYWTEVCVHRSCRKSPNPVEYIKILFPRPT